MNFNKFTIKSQEVVQRAVELASQNGQQAIETPHLLKAVIEKGENVVQFLFGKMMANQQALLSVVDSQIASLPKVSGGEPYLSRETNDVLLRAEELAQKTGTNLSLWNTFYWRWSISAMPCKNRFKMRA